MPVTKSVGDRVIGGQKVDAVSKQQPVNQIADGSAEYQTESYSRSPLTIACPSPDHDDDQGRYKRDNDEPKAGVGESGEHKARVVYVLERKDRQYVYPNAERERRFDREFKSLINRRYGNHGQYTK